ncbi:MAG TPA: site-2 protease family protein [Thermoanaerobaculia bacterium]|nr:site-2 protease family protein [Thermoanaerobaculia bacterium]
MLPPSGTTPVPGIHVPGEERPYRPRYLRAAILFLLTFFTTTTLGPAVYLWTRTDMTTDLLPWMSPGVIRGVWSDPFLLRLGLSFSVPVLLILLAHELGHYIACRRYGLSATLPYFLPLPLMLGTLGAFIRIRSPIRGKRELFDVGVAGPLAGFVMLVPFLLYGVARSEPALVEPGIGSLLVPGHCLALDLAVRLFHGPLEEGMVMNFHPFALAAWFGLLATAINLIPLGQLDGGHILYAAAGRWQRRLAVPIWLLLAVAGFSWSGWWVWCVMVLLMGLFHPPVRNERQPLDRKRILLAWVALAVLILSFIPRGVEEYQTPTRPGPGEGSGVFVALRP